MFYGIEVCCPWPSEVGGDAVTAGTVPLVPARDDDDRSMG